MGEGDGVFTILLLKTKESNFSKSQMLIYLNPAALGLQRVRWNF
jgi:hypothetical protein